MTDTDPLDMPLPCRIELPGVAFGEGVRLRVLVNAAARWKKTLDEMHQAAAPTSESTVEQLLAECSACLGTGYFPTPEGRRICETCGGRATTPAAHWRQLGEPDPHGDRYACERAALPMGHLTDDLLANAVFLNPSIVNLTAAKDRIRWLSRALEAARSQPTPQPEATE